MFFMIFLTDSTCPTHSLVGLLPGGPPTIVFMTRRYWSSLKLSKNEFPIAFSKIDLTRGGAKFDPIFSSSKKAKPPGICASFGGNVGETQLHQ